jgi:hypothetical protein
MKKPCSKRQTDEVLRNAARRHTPEQRTQHYPQGQAASDRCPHYLLVLLAVETTQPGHQGRQHKTAREYLDASSGCRQHRRRYGRGGGGGECVRRPSAPDPHRYAPFSYALNLPEGSLNWPRLYPWSDENTRYVFSRAPRFDSRSNTAAITVRLSIEARV